ELSHARYAELRDGGSPAAGRLLSAFCRAFASRLRRSGQQRVGGASTITTLRALHGDDSTPARPSWTPRSTTGDSGWMDSRDIVAALDAAGAFRPVDVVDQAYAQALRKDVEMLAPTFGIQSHKDGDPIVKAGDGVDGLFVILEGRVRVTVGDEKGGLAVDRLLGPGQTFGQIAFFDGGSRSATCAAEGPLKLAVVYPAAVQELVAGAKRGRSMGLHFMDWIARQLASDLRDMHRRVTSGNLRAFESA
ncbi:MAG: Crp/Fnr family transcriptional regulator, partial [Planctomycetota bacterium]